MPKPESPKPAPKPEVPAPEAPKPADIIVPKGPTVTG